MANVWTVPPEEVNIELKFVDGDNTYPFWIRVKKSLTVGEARRVATAGWHGISNFGKRGRDEAPASINIDWKMQSFARTEAYLLDWSLEDSERRKLPLTRDSIEALHPEVFELIETAISEHVDRLEQEKKLRVGASAPSTTSV